MMKMMTAPAVSPNFMSIHSKRFVLIETKEVEKFLDSAEFLYLG